MSEHLPLGWTPAIPMERYLADPGVSSSLLKLQGQAPALAKASMDGKLSNSDTKASVEGELIHTALLEPDQLDTRYIESGDCQALLGSGKRKGEPCGNPGLAIDPEVGWVCGRHGAGTLPPPDQVVVTSWQLHMALQLRDNALVAERPLHHPAVKALLEQPGQAELTGVGVDLETHERVRIRIDRWLELGWSVDVKSVDVGVGAMDRYVRHLWNQGHHFQQGFYGHVSELLERPVERHVILVAERGFPFILQPYLLPPELVLKGRQSALENLRSLAECRAKGEWPGYSDQLEELELLGWQKALLAREARLDAPDLPELPDAGSWW